MEEGEWYTHGHLGLVFGNVGETKPDETKLQHGRFHVRTCTGIWTGERDSSNIRIFYTGQGADEGEFLHTIPQFKRIALHLLRKHPDALTLDHPLVEWMNLVGASFDVKSARRSTRGKGSGW